MAQFGAPNFLSVIDAFEAGSRRRERNQLRDLEQRGRELAGQVLGGNQNKLAELTANNPQLGMQVQKFTDEQKAQRLDELASGAMAADTPEKWEAFVQRSAAQGHKLDPGETRESILDQAMGWKEKLAQSNADRQFNASQTNSDRSYDLQRRGFNADQSYRQQQIQLERDKLNQPEVTDDIKEYRYYVSQAKAAGQQALPFNDWMTGMKRANATQVNLGGGSDKQIFDALDASAITARSAVTGLASLREAKAALKGGAITGFAANERLAFEKLGALLGFADPSKIVNTETFRSAIAPQVAALMKATVGSTQISNADRDFAEKAAGGSITLDERSISRLLDIMERAGTVAIKSHVDRLDKVYPQDEKGTFNRERAIFGVDMPAAGPATTGKTRRGISFEVGE